METCSIDLAEPLAWFWFSSIFKINVGSAYVSTILDATIPNTPSCHPSLASKRNKWPCLICSSANNNASSVILDTISLRSWLKCSTCSAKNSASSNSSDNKSSAANDASNRGPIIKPIVSSVISSLKPAWFKIAFMDDGVWLFNIFNPCFTIYLFSSVNDTKSAIVPMAANAMKCWGGCSINPWANL